LDPKSGEFFAISSGIFIETHLTTLPEEQSRLEQSRGWTMRERERERERSGQSLICLTGTADSSQGDVSRSPQ
jgi:hypothetical protein